MPICEIDPWRTQYFERVPCPDDVFIPTEDSDAWTWNPEHRWVYDKLEVALSQGLQERGRGGGAAQAPHRLLGSPLHLLVRVAQLFGHPGQERRGRF